MDLNEANEIIEQANHNAQLDPGYDMRNDPQVQEALGLVQSNYERGQQDFNEAVASGDIPEDSQYLGSSEKGIRYIPKEEIERITQWGKEFVEESKKPREPIRTIVKEGQTTFTTELIPVDTTDYKHWKAEQIASDKITPITRAPWLEKKYKQAWKQEQVESAKTGAIGMIPIYGTIRYWKDMPTPMKVISVASDVFFFGSFVRPLTALKVLGGASKEEIAVKNVLNAGRAAERETLKEVTTLRVVNAYDDWVKASNNYAENISKIKTLSRTRGEVEPELRPVIDKLRKQTENLRQEVQRSGDDFAKAQREAIAKAPWVKKAGADTPQIMDDFGKRSAKDIEQTINHIYDGKLPSEKTLRNRIEFYSKAPQNADTVAALSKAKQDLLIVKSAKLQKIEKQLESAKGTKKLKLTEEYKERLKGLEIEWAEPIPRASGRTIVSPGRLGLKPAPTGGGGIRTKEIPTTRQAVSRYQPLTQAELSQIIKSGGLVSLPRPSTSPEETSYQPLVIPIAPAKRIVWVYPQIKWQKTTTIEPLPTTRPKPIPGVTEPEPGLVPVLVPNLAPMTITNPKTSAAAQSKTQLKALSKAAQKYSTLISNGTKPSSAIKQLQKQYPYLQFKLATQQQTKTAIEQATKTKTQEQIKQEIKIPTRTTTPPLKPPPEKPVPPRKIPLPKNATDGAKRKYIKRVEGAIAFRMGELNDRDVWHVITHPFEDERDYLTVMGRKPAGAVIVKGPDSAYKTAQHLYGVSLPSKLSMDIGVTDAILTPIEGKKGVSITFTPDPKLSTTGDITVSGKGGFPLRRERE